MNRLFAFAAVCMFALPATAAQVSGGSYAADSPYGPFGARSDGVYFETTKKTPVFLSNGSLATPMSPFFYADFTGLADGEGVHELQNDGTAYSTTALEVNLVNIETGHTFAQLGFGTQTAGLDADAGALDFAGDDTEHDGMEVLFNGPLLHTRPYYARKEAITACIVFEVDDASGIDELHFGFRSPQTATATFDNNQSFCVLGWDEDAASPNIDFSTDDDGGGTTDGDTGVDYTDGTETTWCVSVATTGVCTATVDGTAEEAHAFTYDDGEPLVAFWTHTQADDPEAAEVKVTKVWVIAE